MVRDKKQSASSSNLEAIAVRAVGNGGQNGEQKKNKEEGWDERPRFTGCERDMDKEMENSEGHRVRKSTSREQPRILKKLMGWTCVSGGWEREESEEGKSEKLWELKRKCNTFCSRFILIWLNFLQTPPPPNPGPVTTPAGH